MRTGARKRGSEMSVLTRGLVSLAYGIGGVFVVIVVWSVAGALLDVPNDNIFLTPTMWVAFFVFAYFGWRGRGSKAKGDAT